MEIVYYRLDFFFLMIRILTLIFFILFAVMSNLYRVKKAAYACTTTNRIIRYYLPLLYLRLPRCDIQSAIDQSLVKSYLELIKTCSSEGKNIK